MKADDKSKKKNQKIYNLGYLIQKLIFILGYFFKDIFWIFLGLIFFQIGIETIIHFFHMNNPVFYPAFLEKK